MSTLRINDITNEKLNYLSQITGLSKAKLAELGINLLEQDDRLTLFTGDEYESTANS